MGVPVLTRSACVVVTSFQVYRLEENVLLYIMATH